MAAIVALSLMGLVLYLKTRPPGARRRAKGGGADPLDNLVQMARERPVIAAGALVAASIIAFRNPAIAALIAKSMFDSKRPKA